jgi:TIR domain
MRIFISYSHRDKDWLERLQIHLKPIVRQLSLDIWDDTRIRPGSKWRQEIAQAIDGSDVAILLISADFLASDFISANELPPLLRAGQEAGVLILPVIAAPSLFSYQPELAQFQAANDPSKPLISLSRAEQEAVFVSIAESIYKHTIDTGKKSKEMNIPLHLSHLNVRREAFLEHQTWTRLVKIGDWVYDQEAKRIVGGGVHTYLLSREEYGNAPFSLTATLSFSSFVQHLRRELVKMNAGIMFGWNSDDVNPKYYNVLITGERILLEKIGFNGGDAYRDYYHITEGVDCTIEENRIYEFSISFSSRSIDVFLDQQLYCSFSCPSSIVGRVGLRPWRSQIHCSKFTISEVSGAEQKHRADARES